MPTPRKHAELIKKWADDTSLNIQYKEEGEWIDTSINPIWSARVEYRIKPKTIRYKIALLVKNGRSWTVSVDDEAEAKEEMTSDCFIKWLTDWIEVEI